MTIQSLMLCSTNCSLTEALRARESVSRQKYGNSHLTVHPVTVQKQKVNDFLTFVKYLCIIYSMTAVILCAQNGKFLNFPRYDLTRRKYRKCRKLFLSVSSISHENIKLVGNYCCPIKLNSSSVHV